MVANLHGDFLMNGGGATENRILNVFFLKGVADKLRDFFLHFTPYFFCVKNVSHKQERVKIGKHGFQQYAVSATRLIKLYGRGHVVCRYNPSLPTCIREAVELVSFVKVKQVSQYGVGGHYD